MRTRVSILSELPDNLRPGIDRHLLTAITHRMIAISGQISKTIRNGRSRDAETGLRDGEDSLTKLVAKFARIQTVTP